MTFVSQVFSGSSFATRTFALDEFFYVIIFVVFHATFFESFIGSFSQFLLTGTYLEQTKRTTLFHRHYDIEGRAIGHFDPISMLAISTTED